MLNKIFRKAFWLVLTVFFLLGTQGLTSCASSGQPPLAEIISTPTIDGTWISDYGDKYVIDGNIFTHYGVEENVPVVEYAGVIVREFGSKQYGYITIIIADGGRQGKTIGNFYVDHWKELTHDSIKFAGAYKEGGKPDTLTIEEAILELTVANGYFEMYDIYKKIK